MTVTIGAVPPEEALRALRVRGARPFDSFSWQDVDAAEHAVGFTVAKSAGFDVATDIFDAVQALVAEGRTIREATRDLRPILEAKGWWGRKLVTDPLTGETVVAQLGSVRRLELIFSVNARVSYAAGHWARFEAQKATRPYLRYVAILDGRTRPEHALWHNVCLPVDHPWWDTHAPPCGWNCRCTLQSLSERDVARMRDRLKMEPPTIETRPWTNSRTGEILHVPIGIDPGWGHNPGKAGAHAAAAAEKAARSQTAFDAALRGTPAVVVPPPPAPAAERALAVVDRSQIGMTEAEMAALIASWPDLGSTLTSQQALLVRWYTGPGYRAFNAALRDLAASPEQLLVRDALNEALEAFPIFKGMVIRTIRGDVETIRAAHPPGEIVRYDAFTSATRPPRRRFPGNVHYVIQSETGRMIDMVSLLPQQREVLFKAGSHFRVLDVRQEGAVMTVVLKQEPDEVAGPSAHAAMPRDLRAEARAMLFAYDALPFEDVDRAEMEQLADKMQSAGLPQPVSR